MINEIKYLASWSSVKLSKKLGQRGAEMVEYAIVLACIAAVGVYFYSTASTDPKAPAVAKNGLAGFLKQAWAKVSGAVN